MKTSAAGGVSGNPCCWIVAWSVVRSIFVTGTRRALTATWCAPGSVIDVRVCTCVACAICDVGVRATTSLRPFHCIMMVSILTSLDYTGFMSVCVCVCVQAFITRGSQAAARCWTLSQPLLSVATSLVSSTPPSCVSHGTPPSTTTALPSSGEPAAATTPTPHQPTQPHTHRVRRYSSSGSRRGVLVRTTQQAVQYANNASILVVESCCIWCVCR